MSVIRSRYNLIPLSQILLSKRNIESLVKHDIPNRNKIIKDSYLGLDIVRLRSIETLNSIIQKLHYGSNSKNETIIIEGKKFIEEAFRCNLQMRSLIFSKTDSFRSLNKTILLHLQSGKDINIYKVSYHDLKIWSSLLHPPGIIGIFNKPNGENQLFKYQNNTFPITIICDNIRDPYNLGSIIRIGAALSCETVLLMRGCCDPWQTKALRGSCGGHFCIPIKHNMDWNTLPSLFLDSNGNAINCSIFLAESNLNVSKQIDYINLENLKATFPTNHHIAVVIGGEAHGLSEKAFKILPHSERKIVHIPLSNGIDSLNAASALALIIYKIKECLTNK